VSRGYEFVPLPDRIERRRREEACLDRRVTGTVSGRIELVYRTEQSVHVGAGYKKQTDQGIARAGVCVLERPGVPGASLKGAIRSRYEAITCSCVPLYRSSSPVRSQSHPEIKFAEFSRDVKEHKALIDCGKGGREALLCPACALFGRMSHRSRVTVTDFRTPVGTGFTLESMRQQFGPNLHHVGQARIVSGAKFEITSLLGRKFAVGLQDPPPQERFQLVECMPAATELRGELRLFNLTHVELGALMVAIGASPASAMRLGGGKGIGFGRVRLRQVIPDLRDERRRSVEPRLEDWRSAFLASADCWHVGEQALLKMYQGGA